MVNLLPLGDGETISNVLTLPEDEAEWGGLVGRVRHRQGLCAAQQHGCLCQCAQSTAKSR